MKQKLKVNRAQLLPLIRQHCVTVGTAVEVGTYKGNFAEVMISRLKPETFHAVDPLRLFPGMVSFPGQEFKQQESLDRLANVVSKKMEKYGHNLIRETSEVASEQFEDESVDVVYIDGDHTYEGCKADISYWWPKIKPGSILCGHDYQHMKNRVTGMVFGVIPAVDEFVQEHNLDLYITSESDCPSWLVVKGNEPFNKQ